MIARASVGLVVLAAGLLFANAAGGDFEEPVSVVANAPSTVVAGRPFGLSVDVRADPGALDIAAQPLRLRVRLAPECGGSFAGTEGPTAVDRQLPPPSPGAAYAASVAVKAQLGAPGQETLCAFVEDAEERQFATDTEATLLVVPGCAAAKGQLQRAKLRLRRLTRRIRALRHRLRRAHGAKRRQLARRIHRLRAKRRRLARRARRAVREAQIACAIARRPVRARMSSAQPSGLPQIKHLFLIVLENENAGETFGDNPPAPYLGTTLRQEGAFIANYFGIGHLSLDNYVAMVSGQPPNVQTQADCQVYTEMLPGIVREDGVALGEGCVYPRSVPTIANQLENSGQSWRGYMQDMASSAGEPTSCRHPAIGAADQTQQARAGDQYAARHNPFVYFHSIIDYATCARNDVDLSQLTGDLANETTTPAYSFITPDLCHDGHDETCADGTSPGGFAGIEAFLREWVPRIKASPAYKDQGAILVTFDESGSGAESCCNEQPSPNTPNNGGTMPGSGGGRVGAVLLSPCVAPGTVTQTAYNHYSLLRWSEDNFGLAHLAEAGAEGLRTFGSDVFTRPGCEAESAGNSHGQPGRSGRLRLRVRPRRVRAGTRHVFRFRLAGDPACMKGARIRFAGHTKKTNARGQTRMRLRLSGSGRRAARAITRSGCAHPRTTVRLLSRR